MERERGFFIIFFSLSLNRARIYIYCIYRCKFITRCCRGCAGGYPSLAWKYIQTKGVVTKKLQVVRSCFNNEYVYHYKNVTYVHLWFLIESSEGNVEASWLKKSYGNLIKIVKAVSVQTWLNIIILLHICYTQLLEKL